MLFSSEVENSAWKTVVELRKKKHSAARPRIAHSQQPGCSACRTTSGTDREICRSQVDERSEDQCDQAPTTSRSAASDEQCKSVHAMQAPSPGLELCTLCVV